MHTTEELKQLAKFDELVAQLIQEQLSRGIRLDKEKVIQQVKAKINPRIHRQLPDPGFNDG